VGVLALAACGGAPGDGATGDGRVVIGDGLVAAAASTMDAGSARMTMTMTMSVPGLGPVSVTADGVTEFATGDSQMSMDMGALLAGLGDASDGGTVEVRVLDGVVYLRYPEPLASMLGGAAWFSIDARAALGAQNEGMLGPFGQADPTQYLEYLAAVSSSVEEIGRERVRDVETTRYHAVVDFEKAVEDVPRETLAALGIDPETFDEHLAQMRAVVGADMPIDVWVDDGGRARRMHMDMTFDGVSATVDMELFDYGVDVTVEAPPAHEVTDMSAALGAAGGGFGVPHDGV
jgi:hypothetical protein